MNLSCMCVRVPTLTHLSRTLEHINLEHIHTLPHTLEHMQSTTYVLPPTTAALYYSDNLVTRTLNHILLHACSLPHRLYYSNNLARVCVRVCVCACACTPIISHVCGWVCVGVGVRVNLESRTCVCVGVGVGVCACVSGWVGVRVRVRVHQ